MRVQAKEEHAHAMKIYEFIIARGGKVALETIDAPKAKWASPGKVFEESYAHEQKVTGYINDLVDLAIKEKDHATFEFLQWFVREQVEEEANASDILSQINIVGDIDRDISSTWTTISGNGNNPAHLFSILHRIHHVRFPFLIRSDVLNYTEYNHPP